MTTSSISSISWPTHAVMNRLSVHTYIRQDGCIDHQRCFFDGHEITDRELLAISDSVSDEQWQRLDHPVVFYQL